MLAIAALRSNDQAGISEKILRTMVPWPNGLIALSTPLTIPRMRFQTLYEGRHIFGILGVLLVARNRSQLDVAGRAYRAADPILHQFLPRSGS